MAFTPIEKIRVDEGFSSRLPNPSEKEFQGLVEDIRSRGVLVDLLVTKDGLLLDGHRRLQAAKEAGLSAVPTKTLELVGEADWEETVVLSVNLLRRQLNEVQRACIGSSLLRLEREKAKERLHIGQEKGRAHRWRKGLVVDDDHPQPKERLRATQKVAEAVGISRQTLERVEAVKARDPEAIRALLQGEISIAAAYRKVKTRELARRLKEEETGASAPGSVEDLKTVIGKYRCVYLDPPWGEIESDGAGNGSGGKVTFEALAGLPLKELAHKDGCHYWIWSPWSMIRKGVIQRLLEAWKLPWVAELIWDKGQSGRGRWFHARTEVLILAILKGLPLLKSDIDPMITAKAGNLREKPEEIYKLVESVSGGPRIDLFASHAKKGWDRWKGEV